MKYQQMKFETDSRRQEDDGRVDVSKHQHRREEIWNQLTSFLSSSCFVSAQNVLTCQTAAVKNTMRHVCSKIIWASRSVGWLIGWLVGWLVWLIVGWLVCQQPPHLDGGGVRTDSVNFWCWSRLRRQLLLTVFTQCPLIRSYVSLLVYRFSRVGRIGLVEDSDWRS